MSLICINLQDYLRVFRSINIYGKNHILLKKTKYMSETVFIEPSRDYEKLTSQVDFLGNHSLASDMRSITLSSSGAFKIITGFIAFMLIFILIPMIVWVVWMLRERRNTNKRTQMMNSAIMFVKSTPVPEAKVGLIDQLQMRG